MYSVFFNGIRKHVFHFLHQSTFSHGAVHQASRSATVRNVSPWAHLRIHLPNPSVKDRQVCAVSSYHKLSPESIRSTHRCECPRGISVGSLASRGTAGPQHYRGKCPRLLSSLPNLWPIRPRPQSREGCFTTPSLALPVSNRSHV